MNMSLKVDHYRSYVTNKEMSRPHFAILALTQEVKQIDINELLPHILASIYERSKATRVKENDELW